MSKEDYGELPLEDFTHGLYKNVLAIKHLLWFNLIALTANLGYWILWARIPSFY